MKVGVIVPQGWTGEYDGWDALEAWGRTVKCALRAERLGFESIWLFDHFHTVPRPTDEITFESFTSLSALASLTSRVRLGHIVICGAFRNPALVAKMISTMDVISGGRMELGIGAGWKKDEWLAYGYGYPETPVRLKMLADDLEIISRMMAPGHATWEGQHASVRDAINVPKPLQQPRVPITVGGNGRKVTWNLAARYADELNLDAVAPSAVPEAMSVIRQRCEEVDRDPSTLRVSVHMWGGGRDWLRETGEQDTPMADLLAAYREAGVARVMTLVSGSAASDDALDRFAEDARAAGCELTEAVPA
jgi:F420-dependent oxidoreductase-like protein